MIIMPSLKQYLEKLGLRAGKSSLSSEAAEALKLALKEAAEEQKRNRKEIEQLRKTLEQRLGSFTPEALARPGTMAGILRRLHQHGPRFETIIDIGASDAQWTKLAMQSFPQHRYLMVEAQPVHDATLKTFASSHPNVQVVMAAAGAAQGEIHFDATDPFGGQASDKPYAANNIVVPVTTLDHEVASRALPGPFLIKFDTHGFEMPILKGSAQVLQQTSVIIMECYNFKISPDCLIFPEMCAHLQSLGFRCIDMADVMHRNYDQALWQMDLVFVRADRPEVAHLGFN
ncbi:hypothetical protein AYO49_04605 [Verrucomicrobiaceae bacterium SCGC AG-212-N21]|nr:hypothetical protein AYO49_04605 [Verrucomicrobiaceae bacterium SCGC AG-212-N21]